MGNSSAKDMNPIKIPPSAKHTASLIFLHGLGDTGHGWAENFRALKFSNVSCVCPTAPSQPVSLNGGIKMPSWFDIYGLTPDSKSDEDGVKKSSELLKQYIKAEEDKGIPSNKIFIGGFSQGGAVSLYTALTIGKPLAGVIALSSWLPVHQKFPNAIVGDVSELPVFQGHGHHDPMVPYKWGELTHSTLKQIMKKAELKGYHGMMHSSCDEEMQDVKDFIEKIVKPEICQE